MHGGAISVWNWMGLDGNIRMRWGIVHLTVLIMALPLFGIWLSVLFSYRLLLRTGGWSCLGGSWHGGSWPRSANPHHPRPRLLGWGCCCLWRRTRPRGLQRTFRSTRLVGGHRLPCWNHPRRQRQCSGAKPDPLAGRTHGAGCWSHVTVCQRGTGKPRPHRPLCGETHRRGTPCCFPLPRLGAHH